MNYTKIQKLNSQDAGLTPRSSSDDDWQRGRVVQRFTGVHKSTFQLMLRAWEEYHITQSNAGRPTKLNRPDQLLVALQYWREYRTYFHIAQDWEISEATVCRIIRRVETALMQSGRFRIPGKKHLIKGFKTLDVVVIDVTETPIERPKKRQKRYYSGKKKQHTLKCQILAERDSAKIICLFVGEGSRHDFRLFKTSGIQIHPETESLQDSGYQGIKAYHSNSYIPKKKPKNRELTQLERDYNHALSQERISIEHINRRLKIFKILAGRYAAHSRHRLRSRLGKLCFPHRRCRFKLRCNLIAALYNYELYLAV